eukprot:TRINITY_DN5428_c0_g1_i1.p1 TRINITY_DN5428_c0_g1~~TRINITY_DN5428_c0_g1_i1.p1  ORF type:complete len:201 (-),score=46.30 TRINITY_DN5428_c0_g1_i1:731-1333(-)
MMKSIADSAPTKLRSPSPSPATPSQSIQAEADPAIRRPPSPGLSNKRSQTPSKLPPRTDNAEVARRPSPSVSDRLVALAAPKKASTSELAPTANQPPARPSSASGSRPRSGQTPSKRPSTPQGVVRPPQVANIIKTDSARPKSLEIAEGQKPVIGNKPLLSARPRSSSMHDPKKQGSGLPSHLDESVDSSASASENSACE